MGVPIYPTTGVGGEPQLVEFTSTEEQWLSYQIGLQLLRDSDYGALNDSAGTSIGTFTNTFFNEPVGTHPSTSITIGSTTKTIYQNLGSASEDSADWHRPLEVYDSGGFAGIREMDDASLNAAVDRYLTYIFTNDLPGTYKLASSSPGASYTASVSPAFTDTRTDGTSVAYNLYRRTSYTPPAEVKPAKVRYAGDVIGADFEGVQEMTNAEIKTTFGQRAKSRINASGIGKYQIRNSSQGAPTDPGTWVAKGTAIDTRQQVADEDFTRNSTNTFIAEFTRNSTSDFLTNYQATYTGNFLGNYISNYLTNYDTDYTTIYEPPAYISNFTRNSTTVYTGDFLGNFIGNYVTNFTRNSTTVFTGDFLGNFVGDYAILYERNFTRDSTTNFTGDFIGNYLGGYQRNFTRDSTRNSTNTFTGDFTGDFVGNYVRNFTRNSTAVFTGDFIGDYTGNFIGNYAIGYVRAFPQYYERIYTGGPYQRDINYVSTSEITTDYQRSFTGNFTGNFEGNFAGDYVRTFGGGGPANSQAYTGPGDPDNIAFIIGGGTRTTPLNYTDNTFGSYLGTLTLPGLERVYVGPPNPGVTLINSGLGIDEERGAYGASFEGPLIYIRNAAYYVGLYAAYSRIMAYEGPTPAGSFMYFSHGDQELAYVGPLAGAGGAGYDRNFLGNYARLFSRTSTRTSVGNYLRTVTYAGDYVRTTNFSDSSYAIYTGGNYLRLIDLTFTRNFTRDSTRNSTRNSTTNFTGDFLGNFAFDFTRNSTRNSTNTFTGDFLGNFVGDYAILYERNFTRTRITTYTGNFVGNYAGGYQRNFTRDSTRNSTNTFTGDFTGDYARDFTRDSTRNSTSAYTGDFEGNYQSDYIATYDRIYTNTYETAYETDFTRDSTSDFNINYVNIYTGDFIGNYTENYVGDFIGNFLGETIQSSSQTIETYTLYVRIA